MEIKTDTSHEAGVSHFHSSVVHSPDWFATATSLYIILTPYLNISFEVYNLPHYKTMKSLKLCISYAYLVCVSLPKYFQNYNQNMTSKYLLQYVGLICITYRMCIYRDAVY